MNSPLTFLGNGSAFNHVNNNNSAYIKDGETLFLIDCGATTFSELQKSGVLPQVSHVYVLVTHTHDDHVGSLGSLILYGYYMMGTMFEPAVTVIHHNNHNLHNYLSLVGAEGKYEDYKVKENHKTTINGLARGSSFLITLEPIEVNHVEGLYTCAYELNYQDSFIYYSADTYEIPETVLEGINNKDYTHVYQDVCKEDYEGNVHLSLRKLGELISIDPHVRKRIHCMHLDKDYSSEAEKLGFTMTKKG